MKYYYLGCNNFSSKDTKKEFFIVYVLCCGSGHKYIIKNVFVNKEVFSYLSSNNDIFDDISQLVSVSLTDTNTYNLFISI